MTRVATIPNLRLRSLNQTLREDGRRRHGRQKKLLGQLAPFARVGLGRAPGPDAAVVFKIVRVAPRHFDDDNLRGGDPKSVRDWLTKEYLGRADDKDGPRLRFEYGQERGGPNVYAVRIEMTVTEASDGTR